MRLNCFCGTAIFSTIVIQCFSTHCNHIVIISQKILSRLKSPSLLSNYSKQLNQRITSVSLFILQTVVVSFLKIWVILSVVGVFCKIPQLWGTKYSSKILINSKTPQEMPNLILIVTTCVADIWALQARVALSMTFMRKNFLSIFMMAFEQCSCYLLLLKLHLMIFL